MDFETRSDDEDAPTMAIMRRFEETRRRKSLEARRSSTYEKKEPDTVAPSSSNHASTTKPSATEVTPSKRSRTSSTVKAPASATKQQPRSRSNKKGEFKFATTARAEEPRRKSLPRLGRNLQPIWPLEERHDPVPQISPRNSSKKEHASRPRSKSTNDALKVGGLSNDATDIIARFTKSKSPQDASLVPTSSRTFNGESLFPEERTLKERTPPNDSLFAKRDAVSPVSSRASSRSRDKHQSRRSSGCCLQPLPNQSTSALPPIKPQLSPPSNLNKFRAFSSLETTPTEVHFEPLSSLPSRSASLEPKPASRKRAQSLVEFVGDGDSHHAESTTASANVAWSLRSRRRSSAREEEAEHVLERRATLAQEDADAVEAMLKRREQHNPEIVHQKRWFEVLVHAWAASTWLGQFPRVKIQDAARRAALQKLTNVFVPLWRRHKRWQRLNALFVIERFIMSWAKKRRVRRRNWAADRVRHFLNTPVSYFVYCMHGYRAKMIRIQRAFRLWQIRREAQAELAVRLIKAKYEKLYWSRASVRLKSGFFEGRKRINPDDPIPTIPIPVLKIAAKTIVKQHAKAYHKKLFETKGDTDSRSQRLADQTSIRARKQSQRMLNAHRTRTPPDLARQDSVGESFDLDRKETAVFRENSFGKIEISCPNFSSSRSPTARPKAHEERPLHSSPSPLQGCLSLTSMPDESISQRASLETISTQRSASFGNAAWTSHIVLSSMRRVPYSALLSEAEAFACIDSACRSLAVFRDDKRWVSHLK